MVHDQETFYFHSYNVPIAVTELMRYVCHCCCVPPAGCVPPCKFIMCAPCRWYRTLCLSRTQEKWQRGCTKVSAQTRVTPYLLRMKWKGHPLNYHPQLGWGYIVSPGSKPGELPEWGEEEESERYWIREVTQWQLHEAGRQGDFTLFHLLLPSFLCSLPPPPSQHSAASGSNRRLS